MNPEKSESRKNKKSVQNLLEFGIINIDKPAGPTSFDISDFIRKTLGLRKTSHFGTLDPKVTGVLPIALNRACKLTGYFLGEDKEYAGIMRLHEEIPIEKIREKIKEKFLGKIMQKPPVKSRVKRQFRERAIHKFEILEQAENKKDFLFKTEVEGGTYIRKLIDDLGKELGIGAHMLELRRIRAGIFIENSVVNLYDFEKAVEKYKNGNENPLIEMIIPAEESIKKVYPVIKIKSENLKHIFTGKPIYKNDLVKDEDESIGKRQKFKINNDFPMDGRKKDSIASVFCNEKFVGMYRIVREREIFAKPEFVMQPIE